jgi:hypothetical protein
MPDDAPDTRRIDWVNGAPREIFVAYARWHAAVQRVADTGDMTPLIELLRAEVPPRDACILLADLLSSRRLKRKQGRQADPTRVSLLQGGLHLQAARYHGHRKDGLDHDEALRAAIVDFKIEETLLRGLEPPDGDELAEAVTDTEIERLHNHLHGRHGTSRRLRKRRPA